MYRIFLPPPKTFLHLVIIMIDWPELSSSSFSSPQRCILQHFRLQSFHFTKEQVVFLDGVSLILAHYVSFVSPPHTIYYSYIVGLVLFSCSRLPPLAIVKNFLKRFLHRSFIPLFSFLYVSKNLSVVLSNDLYFHLHRVR